MIYHVLHGFTFSGKNLRSFNTSKISKPWLRHSLQRKSKSSELITRESMSIMRSIITPYKAWSVLKLEVTHFFIFGSCAWARIPSEKRKPIDPQRIEYIFVGYPNGVNGYRLIDISSYCLIIERSVQFEESVSHVPQQSHADTFILPPD
jgi:hypothetical protein